MKTHRLTHMTTLGVEVKIRYVDVDQDYVRITEYARRKPGHNQFRKDPGEAGQLVRRSQLPL